MPTIDDHDKLAAKNGVKIGECYSFATPKKPTHLKIRLRHCEVSLSAISWKEHVHGGQQLITYVFKDSIPLETLQAIKDAVEDAKREGYIYIEIALPQ